MKILLIVLLILKKIVLISCDSESSVILSLVKNLEIRHCFIVQEDVTSSKLLSGKKDILMSFAAAYISFQKLLTFKKTKYNHLSLCVILKENHLADLEVLTQALDQINKTYVLSLFTWILFVQNSNQIFHPEKLKIPYNCEFIIVQSETTSSYKLIEYYAIKNKPFIYNFGKWTDSYGLETTNISFYWRRLNLNRTRITTLQYELYAKNCKPTKHHEFCQTAKLIDYFNHMMNFENHIFPVPYKVIHQPMLWLEYGTNIVCDPATFTKYTETDNYHFSQTGPIYKTFFNWYIKHPTSVLRSDYFTRPFHKDLWMAIFFFIVVGNIFVIILTRLKPEKKTSIIDKTFLIFESFCNQSGNDKMENTYLKIICTVSQIMAVIIITSFGAVISSFVAVETIQVPFTNVEEFVQNGQYKLYINPTSSMDAYISKQRNSPVFEAIYKDYVYYDDAEGQFTVSRKYHALCSQDRLAILSENYAIEKFINFRKAHNTLECYVYRISKPIGSLQNALTLEKFSPYKNAFNHNLLRLYENGIQMKIQQMISFKPLTPFTMEKIEEFHSVELKQMELVLSIPLFGILLAMLIVIWELIYKFGNNKP